MAESPALTHNLATAGAQTQKASHSLPGLLSEQPASKTVAGSQAPYGLVRALSPAVKCPRTLVISSISKTNTHFHF